MVMEYIALGLFCLSLLVCLISGASIIFALAAGLVIFSVYALRKGFTMRQVAGFSAAGVKTVKNILISFFLIGMLTALWREAGTIPVIVCFAARLIRPPIFLLMTFLLNCLLSVLTGTAFGTAATMGVICATIGASLGISPVYTGGAILSGVYFGDRCSPVSTSALLVSALTETDIFSNIRGMLKTAAVPFVISCAAYALLGAAMSGGGEIPALESVFGMEFELSAWAVLPAAVLLILALCRVNVRTAMTASIAAAIPVCLLVQHTPPGDIVPVMLKGFTAEHGEIAAMLDGGGVVSMVKLAVIVCISSAYSGIFQNTGLLKNIQTAVQKLAEKTTSFAAILAATALTGMIACNQALTVLLTNQLASGVEKDKSRFAVALEDSAVVVAPLVPWSIAGAVPLASVDAPTLSILFAWFLYLLPLCELVKSIIRKRRT